MMAMVLQKDWSFSGEIKTFKNIDYWISYSYLDSKRDFMNYPMSLKPNFASEHTLSVVAKDSFLS
jgi:hypothetical protein